MTNDSPAIIETYGLCKTYPGATALESLDLRVPRHSIFGFLGPNGAGKSTTIKLLLGLIKPTSGRGEIFGLDIQHQSDDIRRRVGYLAQEPRFFGRMTARETLRFAAGFFISAPRDVIEQRIEKTLDLVGLTDLADRPVRGFSGGERQRLGIAQAYVHQPELMILDEPASALDPQGRRDVLAIMETLKDRCTIFYSTHILDDVQRVSDSVAILNAGSLVAQAPIGQLLRSSGHAVYNLTTRSTPIDVLRESIEAQPWAATVTVETVDGHHLWQITVNDDHTAERELLPLVVRERDIIVTYFGKKMVDLEDVFMELVEGTNR